MDDDAEVDDSAEVDAELGCPVCRAGAHTIDIPEVGLSMVGHVIVHRCAACATYWLETERYLAAVPDEQAYRDAPDVVPAPRTDPVG